MSKSPERESFFPSGALASFGVMVAAYIGLWCALYWLMAARG